MSRDPPARFRRAGHGPSYTDESAWRAWTGWSRLPGLRLPVAGSRVVVLAAHPDDDVLAVGGLLARLARLGCRMLFVTATDGEASHPGSPSVTPAELRERRRRELDAALAALGHGDSERLVLGLPDSALEAYEAELVERLGPHLRDAAVALAPWSGDGHPDHEAAGRAARTAAHRRTPSLSIWEYPVWAWHWAAPGDSRLPWQTAGTIQLQPSERVAKSAAVECFVSQLRPLSRHPADAAVLTPEVVAHFVRPVELVFADEQSGDPRP